jgi:urate oxidase / 2-oxo-4-hydroxy-4-carboxy-5-ureidoimidazoline decarboxylase
MQPHDATYYGQGEIAFYRTYATPLSVRPPPESNFNGKPNTIVGASLWAVVSGPAFQSCYTRGDNSMLVPTQSFANFIHQHADKYTGATLEGFVDFIARRFLATYPHMTAMRVTARDIPFVPVRVPERDGFVESDALYKRSEDEHATVAMEYGEIPRGPSFPPRTLRSRCTPIAFLTAISPLAPIETSSSR